MAEVALSGVAKRFGETLAVAELSFTVADGEFFVLLGPTGAGKTTTLRTVAGLERPDAGSVHIGGTDMTGAAPAQRDVAFVFQQFSLYPHYTVAENLAFPLRAPGRRLCEAEIDRRVRAVAERLAIADKLGNKATRLSGGEMQRVSIGRALVREPAVFLMDEPLSSLDAKLREALRIELKHLQADFGATILYVTHDQVEALTLADRIGVLHEGRLRQIGTPRAIYTDPDDVLVAHQLGSPAINLLPAEALGVPGDGVAQIGVRPEDVAAVRAPPAAAAPEGELIARVRQVERLGAEDVVLFDWRDHAVRALLTPDHGLAPGEEAWLRPAPDKLLLFDAEGRRVRHWPDQSRQPREDEGMAGMKEHRHVG